MIELTRLNGNMIVRLEVPGIIECRDIVLRTVSAVCRLALPDARRPGSRSSEVDNHLVSAVGEAYNNIALHGYAGQEPGPIQVQIEHETKLMRIVIRDTGTSFDPARAAVPNLAALPESGLGVFIIRSFVDEVTYTAGSPNVLTLVKHLDGAAGSDINGHASGGGT